MQDAGRTSGVSSGSASPAENTGLQPPPRKPEARDGDYGDGDGSNGFGDLLRPGTHRFRAFVASAAGTMFEWYEFALFGAFADIIGMHFFPASDPAEALRYSFVLFFVGFLTRPLGAVVFGYVGDRYGRIPVLVWTAVLMLGPTLAMTLIPPKNQRQIGALSTLLLVVCRILQGLSLGGQAGSGITFVLESVEPRHRAKVGIYTYI
ncbi:major facilitator superfamily domain-containing protein [Pavlovales sp. CCMP2436]|nr:major facilitator superfamily domain-containing protein [Pavlovales sp. CCMP2436]